MKILISNQQNRQKIHQERIQKAAQILLNALESPDGELSVLIVDDVQIADLNEKYLNRKGPTNVIAFPMQEGEFSHITPNLLGDVVISADTARNEGEDAGIGMEERFIQLMIHGILHLFGYDHENAEDEALEMETKSNELWAVVCDNDEWLMML